MSCLALYNAGHIDIDARVDIFISFVESIEKDASLSQSGGMHPRQVADNIRMIFKEWKKINCIKFGTCSKVHPQNIQQHTNSTYNTPRNVRQASQTGIQSSQQSNPNNARNEQARIQSNPGNVQNIHVSNPNATNLESVPIDVLYEIFGILNEINPSALRSLCQASSFWNTLVNEFESTLVRQESRTLEWFLRVAHKHTKGKDDNLEAAKFTVWMHDGSEIFVEASVDRRCRVIMHGTMFYAHQYFGDSLVEIIDQINNGALNDESNVESDYSDGSSSHDSYDADQLVLQSTIRKITIEEIYTYHDVEQTIDYQRHFEVLIEKINQFLKELRLGKLARDKLKKNKARLRSDDEELRHNMTNHRIPVKRVVLATRRKKSLNKKESMSAQKGGKTSHRRSKEKVKFMGKCRTVYLGHHGKKLIRLNGIWVPLCEHRGKYTKVK